MMAVAQYLLYLLALFLPWHPYLDLPQYLLVPTTIITLALIALFLIDAVRRGWRVPFELTLPLALVMLVIIGQMCSGYWAHAGYPGTADKSSVEMSDLVQSLYFLNLCLWPLLMLAVLHFSPERESAQAALRLYAASVAAWGVVTLLAQVLPLFVTSYSMGIQPWYPLGPVVYALPIVLLAAWKGERPGRPIWIAAAGVLAATLLFVLAPAATLPGIKWNPGFPPPNVSWWVLGTTLLVLWPVARIAAKIEVIRRDSADKWTPIFFYVLLVVIVLDIRRRPDFQPVEYFLVALAGAWSLPQRETVCRYKPDWKLAFAAGPLGVLLVFNLLHVNPANYQDPRNYTSFVARAQAMGMKGPLPDFQLDMFNRIESRFPQETQTNYWLAYYDRLARDELYGAAVEYRKSFSPTVSDAYRPILPPPSDEQRRAFLDTLRDRASALPPGEHRGAYVLALSAEGRFDEALALMRRDAESVTPPAIEDSAQPVLAAVVAVYLCQPDLLPRLADWPAADLLALLTAWGAGIEDQPEKCGLAVIIGGPGACDCAAGMAGTGVVISCTGGESGVAIAGCKLELTQEQVPRPREDGAPAVAVRLKK